MGDELKQFVKVDRVGLEQKTEKATEEKCMGGSERQSRSVLQKE